MNERFSDSESLYEMRREARERIVSAAEELRDSEHIIAVADETEDTITLSLNIIDPKAGEIKAYRKGFMKILNFPDGLSAEDEVRKQINFPEE